MWGLEIGRNSCLLLCGAGEMAQWFRLFVAQVEHLGLILSIHTAAHDYPNAS